MRVPWVPLGLLAGVFLLGGSVSSSSSSRFVSLPVSLADYCAACRRRRESGRTAPGSLFGPRPDPFGGTGSVFHAGVDIAVPSGTPLLAVDAGEVIAVELGTSAGDIVRYQTRFGRVSCMHLSSILVRRGAVVTAGEVIGATGYTGRVSPPGPAGAHLHLELRPDGSGGAVDPLPFFPVPPEC